MDIHPKHLPADERRAVTVESVVALAGSQNPSEITTAAIAKHMNLTQGALFRHFPNKEAIWQAVMEWVAERLLARIDRSAQGIESPLAAMEAMFMSHIEFVAEHPGVPRMMFGELQRAESTPAKRMVQTLIQRYGERLDRLIEKGKASGELSPRLTTRRRQRCSLARSRAWSCNRCWRVMWDVCTAMRRASLQFIGVA